MPTIELSSALANSVAQTKMFNRSAIGDQSSGAWSVNGMFVNYTYLNICTGTLPVSLPTTASYITANNLISYNNSSLSPSVVTNSTLVLSTQVRAASASGTATWFVLYTSGVFNNEIYCSVYGNIGTVGSGADLELVSTSITSGTQYRVSGLTITLPTSWTY